MNAKAAHLLAAFSHLSAGAVVVEIGCARFPEERPSDGYSTPYLAEAGAEHGWEFHSVDSDAAAVLNATNLIAGMPGTVHHADGVQWLSHGPQIDGLYLDGSADPQEAVEQYRAAHLAPGAVVVVDDIQPIGEHALGKGHLLLDVLTADGYTVTIGATEPGYAMAVATR